MKTGIQLKALALTVSLIGMGVLAPVAQAALVTQWGYSNDAVFSNATFSGSTGVQISTPSELSWGRNPTAGTNAGDFQNPGTNPSYNRSALTVGNFSVSPETKVGGGPATGSVQTDENGILNVAEIGKGISLTHWNNVLDGDFSTLTGATITDTITLTPQSPSGSAQTGPTLTFNFNFRETPNDGGTDKLCADGLSAANVYGYTSSGGGCPDLFGFISTQVVNQTFSYDNVTYFASVLFLNADGTLDSIGIPALLAGECSALGFGSTTCFGFRTTEGNETTKRFGVAISAVALPVPEPGTLALMGLAMLGLGVMRARKHA